MCQKKNEKESTRDTRNGYLRNPRRREPERNEQRIMNWSMGGSELVERICRQQERCYGTYGYRRVWLWLEQQNIHHNPKTVPRIIKKNNFLAQIRRRRMWKQMGEQRHSAQYSFSYMGAFLLSAQFGAVHLRQRYLPRSRTSSEKQLQTISHISFRFASYISKLWCTTRKNCLPKGASRENAEKHRNNGSSHFRDRGRSLLRQD